MESVMAGFRMLALFLLLLPPCTSVWSRNPGPHVHGVGQVQVAVDGTLLTIVLSSPLDNLLGFERAARTAQEKVAVSRVNEQLRKPQALFQPASEADCVVSSTTIDAPVLDAGPAANAAPGDVATGGKVKAKDKPAHADAGGHADLTAEYVFRCAHPERLRGMEVRLFEAFRGLRQLDVRVAGSRGQSAMTLRRGNTQVSW